MSLANDLCYIQRAEQKKRSLHFIRASPPHWPHIRLVSFSRNECLSFFVSRASRPPSLLSHWLIIGMHSKSLLYFPIESLRFAYRARFCQNFMKFFKFKTVIIIGSHGCFVRRIELAIGGAVHTAYLVHVRIRRYVVRSGESAGRRITIARICTGRRKQFSPNQ